MSETEGRRFKRFVVEHMDILARTVVMTEIHILDIGLGGARISGTKSLKINGTYNLRLESERKTISLRGTVIWEKLSGSRKDDQGNVVPVYLAGIEFNHLKSDKMAELMEFIADFCSTEDQRLAGIRFKVDDINTAFLNYNQTSQVKKLSLGGMLIETQDEVSLDEVHPMELVIPDEKDPIRFDGRVAFCRQVPDTEPTRFDVGIAFENMSSPDKTRLRDFVQVLYQIGGDIPFEQ